MRLPRTIYLSYLTRDGMRHNLSNTLYDHTDINRIYSLAKTAGMWYKTSALIYKCRGFRNERN